MDIEIFLERGGRRLPDSAKPSWQNDQAATEQPDNNFKMGMDPKNSKGVAWMNQPLRQQASNQICDNCWRPMVRASRTPDRIPTLSQLINEYYKARSLFDISAFDRMRIK